MSHSRIYQISSRPICPEDYATSATYEDNSGDFADYIGEAFKGEERDERIRNFGDLIEDVFEPQGGGVFAYRGMEALEAFKQKWAYAICEAAQELNAANLTDGQRLYNIRMLTKETHLRAASRVDIVDWCDGVAYPLSELFEWAGCRLQDGDRIYIGSVIDYHY